MARRVLEGFEMPAAPKVRAPRQPRPKGAAPVVVSGPETVRTKVLYQGLPAEVPSEMMVISGSTQVSLAGAGLLASAGSFGDSDMTPITGAVAGAGGRVLFIDTTEVAAYYDLAGQHRAVLVADAGDSAPAIGAPAAVPGADLYVPLPLLCAALATTSGAFRGWGCREGLQEGLAEAGVQGGIVELQASAQFAPLVLLGNGAPVFVSARALVQAVRHVGGGREAGAELAGLELWKGLLLTPGSSSADTFVLSTALLHRSCTDAATKAVAFLCKTMQHETWWRSCPGWATTALCVHPGPATFDRVAYIISYMAEHFITNINRRISRARAPAPAPAPAPGPIDRPGATILDLEAALSLHVFATRYQCPEAHDLYAIADYILTGHAEGLRAAAAAAAAAAGWPARGLSEEDMRQLHVVDITPSPAAAAAPATAKQLLVLFNIAAFARQSGVALPASYELLALLPWLHALRSAKAYRMPDEREGLSVQEAYAETREYFYLITHVIFAASSWGASALPATTLAPERVFLRRFAVWTAVNYPDSDVVAEAAAALAAFAGSDDDLFRAAARAHLLYLQGVSVPADGRVAAHSEGRITSPCAYHATLLALAALHIPCLISGPDKELSEALKEL